LSDSGGSLSGYYTPELIIAQNSGYLFDASDYNTPSSNNISHV